MLDHLGLFTPPDLTQKTVDFYIATLAPLGYKKEVEMMDGTIVGLSDGAKSADFWIAPISVKQDENVKTGYAHFAFAAKGNVSKVSVQHLIFSW